MVRLEAGVGVGVGLAVAEDASLGPPPRVAAHGLLQRAGRRAATELAGAGLVGAPSEGHVRPRAVAAVQRLNAEDGPGVLLPLLLLLLLGGASVSGPRPGRPAVVLLLFLLVLLLP
jgi:hypothetical protein